MFWNVRPMPRCVNACGGLPGHVLAREDHAARGRLVDAGEHVEERRLAGAVRPDQADDRALRHREVDVVDGDEAAELLAEPLGLEQRVSSSGDLQVVERLVVHALVELGRAPRARDQALRPEEHRRSRGSAPKIPNS